MMNQKRQEAGMMIDDKTKLVFISYSWKKKDEVKKIVDKLIGDGVDVKFDIYDVKGGNDLTAFMEQSVNNPDVDYVLVFCDKTYVEKAKDRKGGVGIESSILSQEVYNDIDQDKVIPIVIEYDGHMPCLPTFLKSRMYIDLTDDNYEEGYEQLIRHIYDKPSNRKPKLGEQPAWLEEESVDYSKIRRIVDSKNPFSEVTDASLFDEVSRCLNELIQPDLPDIKSSMGIIDKEKICRNLVIDYYIKKIDRNDKIGISMGNLLEFLEDNVTYSNDDQRQDLIDFFKWEFVVVFTAILLRFKKYNDLSDLVKRTFLLEPTIKLRTQFHFLTTIARL